MSEEEINRIEKEAEAIYNAATSPDVYTNGKSGYIAGAKAAAIYYQSRIKELEGEIKKIVKERDLLLLEQGQRISKQQSKIQELVEALEKANNIIRAWFKGFGGFPDKWDNYYANSNDMKPIREALTNYNKEC